METILHYLDVALAFLGSISPIAYTVIGVVVELLLRIFPTGKPASFIHGIAGTLSLVASLLGKAAGVVGAGATVLDKVLPQNVKPSELVPLAGGTGPKP